VAKALEELEDVTAAYGPRHQEECLDIQRQLSPFGRYVRSLNGAEFTLQANTAEVPEPGVFFVMQGGTVLFRSEDFELASAHYKGLCQTFWSGRLDSPDVPTGLASAWGLLGLDIDHAGAARVITRSGTPADLKRLQQLRLRARHARGGPGWRRPAR
jgi:hypothetical protein